MGDKYINYPVYGTFKVTTEGDCEGRSTRHLGTWTGYIDQIAFALADKCYYSLEFELVKPEELDMTPKRDSVTIHLDIDSGTWKMDKEERIKYFKELLKDRKGVYVDEVNTYASVTLKRNITDEEIKAQKRTEALKKLTNEEKELLGLI